MLKKQEATNREALPSQGKFLTPPPDTYTSLSLSLSLSLAHMTIDIARTGNGDIGE